MIENRRYFNALKAIYSGVTSPADAEFKNVVDTHIPQTECSKYNPPLEEVLPEIVRVIESQQNIKMPRLKGDMGISRADAMTLYASFTDHHNIDKIDKFKPHLTVANTLIKEIENQFSKTNSPLGISEQLNMALNFSSGDITLAVLNLSLASRMVARNLDSRLLNIKLSEEEIFYWKHLFAPFGYGKKSEDPAGDTYHFWFAMLAGISREEKFDLVGVNNVKQLICDLIYPNTAWACEVVRHRLYLGMKTWATHEVLDRIGYETGRALVGIYGSHNHIAFHYRSM
jgi:hypothetical protein